VIVPRRSWTNVAQMIEALHRNYLSAAYVFRNNYFFTDLPPTATENITFLRYRHKVTDVILWRLLVSVSCQHLKLKVVRSTL